MCEVVGVYVQMFCYRVRYYLYVEARGSHMCDI
jgi:hypothetical protein